jgi:uncharacterized protein YpmS
LVSRKSNLIEPQPSEQKKKPKPVKSKSRRRFWLLIDLAITLIILALLVYRPSGYHPPVRSQTNEVNKYWPYYTSQFYNGAQLQKPFELVLTEEGLNEIVASSGWPKASEGVSFSKPQVVLDDDEVILMGTANIGDVEFIVTLAGKPDIGGDRLLNLKITRIKIGAMNITPIAKIIASQMYAKQVPGLDPEKDDAAQKVIASLLTDEGFEPVFSPPDDKRKKMRIERITVEKGKIVIGFVPEGAAKTAR